MGLPFTKLLVQVAEAIQCRGMHNRLADSIQVMANLSHPMCTAVRSCQYFLPNQLPESAVRATCLELNALLTIIVVILMIVITIIIVIIIIKTLSSS